MKIIGTTKVGEGYGAQEAFIAIITVAEMQRVADKASYHDKSFVTPKVGDDYDIAAGYNFREELTVAIKAMSEAYTKFSKVAPLAAQFAGVVAHKEAAEIKGDTND